MTDKIVFNDSNGLLQVVTATKLEATVNEIVASAVPNGETYKAVAPSDLPDKYFREAWTLSNDSVIIDMGRARDIHMKVIRTARDEQLRILDIETMKGLDVQAEKQVLRDLPSNIDLTVATTPADLKAIWPIPPLVLGTTAESPQLASLESISPLIGL